MGTTGFVVSKWNRRRRSSDMTMLMAVCIGWGTLALALLALGYVIARHNR
jgi:ABC-type thiamin/hydroxymethylpyrimidine transport system permease subunit